MQDASERRSGRSGLLSIALGALSLLAWLAIAPASLAGESMLNDRSEDYRPLLLGVEKAVLAQDWDGVAARLQHLLEKPATHLSRADPKSGSLLYGVRGFAYAYLAGLPPAGRAAYERRYGPLARSLLEQAEGRTAGMRVVANRLLFTEAGAEAVDQLATMAIERGAMGRAAYWLEQLIVRRPIGEIPARQLARLAFCYRSARRGDALRALIERVGERDARLEVGGEPIALSAYLTRLERELAADEARLADLEGWPVPGGDWSQSRVAPFTVNSRKLAWRRQLRGPDDSAISTFGYLTPPNFLGESGSRCIPAVGDGSVFISNGYQVTAFNLFSGDLLWRQRAGFAEVATNTPQDPLQSYTVTYHEGAVYASLEPQTKGQVHEKFRNFDVQVPMAWRQLIKIDATTGKLLWKASAPRDSTFKLEQANLSTPVIRGDLALAVAVSFEGLYNVDLVAFDVETGVLRWSRRLGSGPQSLNLFGRTYREAPVTMPAIDGARVYVQSNLGFVACVDVERAELVWARRYERLSYGTTMTWQLPDVKSGWYNRPPLVSGGRLVCTPLDSDLCLGLDPRTGELHWRYDRRYDPSSGRRLDGDKVLIGTADGKVYSAGRQLRIVDLDSGRLLKTQLLGSEPAGLGAITRQELLISTRNQLLRVDRRSLQVTRQGLSGQGGTVVMAGNVMLVAGERMIGPRHASRWGRRIRYTNPLQISATFDHAEVLDNLRALIRKQPTEPFAYNSLASVLLHQGQLDQAEREFKRALERANKDSRPEYRRARRRAEGGLFSLSLQRVEEHEGRPQQVLELLEQANRYARGESQRLRVLWEKIKLADRSSLLQRQVDLTRELIDRFGGQRVEIGNSRPPAGLAALVRLAEAYARAGKPNAAVDSYQELLVRYDAGLHPASTPLLRRLFGRTAIPTGAEIGRRGVGELIERHGPEIYASHEAQAKKLLASARRNKAPQELEELLRRYPNSSVVDAATLALAESYLGPDMGKEGARRAKRRLALYLGQDRPDKAQARALLFAAYDRLAMYQLASGVLSEMAHQHAGERLPDGRTVEAFIAVQRERPRYRNTVAKLALPRLELGGKAPLWRHTQGLWRVLRVRGLPPTSLRDQGYFSFGSRISARDAASGAERWQVEAGARVYLMAWAGDRLIAWVSSGELVAIDARQGGVLWRTNMLGRIGGFTVSGGETIAVVGAPRERGARGGWVKLVSAHSGEFAWQVPLQGMDRLSSPLAARDYVVAYQRSKDASALVLLSLTTGERSEVLDLGGWQIEPTPILLADANRLVVPLYFSSRKPELRRSRLVLIDLKLGLTKAQRVVKTIDVAGRIAGMVGSGRRFAIDTTGREVLCFGDNGERLWRMPDEDVAGMVVHHRRIDDEQLLLVGRGRPAGAQVEADHVLMAVDMASGRRQWLGQLQEAPLPTTPLLVSQRYAVSVGLDDRPRQLVVSVIDRRNGKLVRLIRREAGKGEVGAGLAGGRLLLGLGNAREAHGKPSGR